jgi:hypothetical protein
VAVGCVVAVGHTEIVCKTVPGVGSALRWVVKVGKQASATSTATTAYAPPSLLGVFPQHVDTKGGGRHVVNGTNLGMASTDMYMQVFLDGVPLSVDGRALTTIFPASSSFMTSRRVDGWEEGDAGPGVWEALEFVMPPLSDEDHRKELVLTVGNRRFGGAKADSNIVIAQYKPPHLFEVQNSPGGSEGTRQVTDLMLLGSNFGSVGSILMDGKPVAHSRIEKWKDDQITLSVVAESGNITVVVGEYRSETLRFDDFSPIL